MRVVRAPVLTRRTPLFALVALLLVGAALLRGLLSASAATRTGTADTSGSLLPGLQTGPAPWGPDTARLRARLVRLGLPALALEGTVLHIHQHVDVFVDGRRVTVPAGIGIDPGGLFISPIHTHDASGVVHVESPFVRRFTLGELFGVWGVRLTQRCLGGYCAGNGRTLRVYVDGRLVHGSPGRVGLTEHEEIAVVFGAGRGAPERIPFGYAFPPGL